MDRSYPSVLRIKQRIRRRRCVAAGIFAVIVLGSLAFAMAADRAASPVAAEPATAAATVPAALPAAGTAPVLRRVYRYSVVPGGAANKAELARIVRSDKVVAAHYAGFDVARARSVIVDAPRAVYVSYRKGDDVYWTANKVTLQTGETLLSDGRSEMRARCANRISDLPRFPVEKHAPSLAALDALDDNETDDGEGGIAYVNAPDLDETGDLPQLAGQSFHLTWPASGDPNPAGAHDSARTPSAIESPPGLPWPQMSWNGYPGLPPQSGASPGAPLLASATAPPLSAALPVQPDPFPEGVTAEPANPTVPPVPGTSEPPHPVPDSGPFIPKSDPSQPGSPLNPTLDLPQPADVPEPASAWLFGAALAAMLGLHKRR